PLHKGGLWGGCLPLCRLPTTERATPAIAARGSCFRQAMRLVSALVICFGLLLATRVGHAQEKESAWDPAGGEGFSLTECHGQTVTKADLLGKPWVACFIFTRCAGPCPRVSEQMQILQNRLKGIDVRLVSFSVDPDRDTPEDLRKYAKVYKADP